MKVVVAIDSMKGCLGSLDASRACAEGIRGMISDAEVVTVPVADGGEGTADAIAFSNTLMKRFESRVSGPLGYEVNAEWWLDEENATAYMDMASASGLTLVPEDKRDPMKASTYGVGQLMLCALSMGAKRIVVGMGGSATVDGGIGACNALKEYGEPMEILLACDVKSPYTGLNGAARVFGPQKGASPEEVEALEARLENIRQDVLKKFGLDLNDVPGSGAAGGCAGGLVAYFGAEIKNGARLVLDLIGFDKMLEGAGLIITGEGSADKQTLMGKLPFEILQRGKRMGIPVVMVAGRIADAKALNEAGFAAILDINSKENISRSHTAGKFAMDKETAIARLKSISKDIHDCLDVFVIS